LIAADRGKRAKGIGVKTVRIGAGAGYGGDRIDPAIDLMRNGDLQYLCFECLAERTIALAHEQMLRDPARGYSELLEPRMQQALPLCQQKRVKLITNMGQANPAAAARVIKTIARKMGLKGLRIAAVIGDDVSRHLHKYLHTETLESAESLWPIRDRIVSANAYIGADGIVEALGKQADVVVAGRVADPSLFLAPLMHEFGWRREDTDRIGKGILVGHLLECAAQVTGGYYADPGRKDVPDLWRVGFPIAEVAEDGDAVITKLEDSGGMVTRDTVIEQLLYEIHDPASYLTPDGVADFSGVTVTEVGKDRVRVTGARGRPRTGMLKVSVGYRDGCIGEGEISYGGHGALGRSRLAEDIIRRRLEHLGVPVEELRVDHIGLDSLYRSVLGDGRDGACSLREVRLRVAARTSRRQDAEVVGNEVEALYLNGPAGGGGARKYVRDIISMTSIYIPEDEVAVRTVIEEA
jgi:hypothetical protein